MGRGERLHNIEVLRGLAALAVSWFHLTNTYAEGDAVRASGSFGWLGVDCFFVISGFVIPYSLHAAGYQLSDFWRFLAKRLVRLEPPYLLSIALVVALGFASALAPGFRGLAPDYSAPQIFSHLLYVIPLTPYPWLQPVYWSLAYEFAFYLSVGLLFSVLWRRSLVLTAIINGAFFLAAFAVTGQWDARILLFLFGIAGARYYAKRDPLWHFAACLVVTAGLITLTSPAGLATTAPITALAGLATVLIIVFVRVPAWRALTGLGTISYSLYLLHVPIGGRVVNLGSRFIHGQAQELALSLVALIVSLFCAWVFYRLVEVASTRASKRIALQKSPLTTAKSPQRSLE